MDDSLLDTAVGPVTLDPPQEAPDLTVHIASSNPAHLLVDGELDAFSAPILRATLREVVESGSGDVTVDTRGVRFVDSSALGVFIASYKSLEGQGRRLRITEQSDHVRRLLDLTGLQEKFS